MTGQLGSLDIHEDAVKRLVPLYHLNTLLPIHCIDNGMPIQLESLSQNKPIDIIVLSVNI